LVVELCAGLAQVGVTFGAVVREALGLAVRGPQVMVDDFVGAKSLKCGLRIAADAKATKSAESTRAAMK
jgi:hypothetical protein